MDSSPQKPDISALKIDKSRKFDDRPRSGWWKWVVGGILVVALVIGYLALRGSLVPSTKVKVTSVVQLGGSDASAELVATGYVVAQRKAEVASKGTGRLAFIGFEEGDSVGEGEVIARLDNEDILASREVARAELNQAGVDTLNASRDYRRRLQLRESGAITEAELETAESNYNSALARYQGALASLRAAQVNLDNTYIRAPFAGTILTKNADVGEIVAPFASSASSKGSVVTLADMSSLEVEADVSEANIYKVAVGQPTEIILDAYPSLKYPGQVKKIVPTADRARATVLVKIAFESKDEKVLPEMSARVNFFSDRPESSELASAIAVHKDAITSRGSVKVVFRVSEGHAELVEVTTGRELGNLVEIIDGLRYNDQVVLSPPGKMEHGQKIEVTG